MGFISFKTHTNRTSRQNIQRTLLLMHLLCSQKGGTDVQQLVFLCKLAAK